LTDCTNPPLKIAQREYPEQRVNGVPQRTVDPPKPARLKRIQRESAAIKAARKTDTMRRDFSSAFVWPITGPITGVFGSRRVYNGVPGRPHYGVDVARPTGSAVAAPADGTVLLVQKDNFYSGGTLIVDHGFGISSTFIHLSKVLVAVGDNISQGQAIAEVGATGRATGPHLDWRMNWFDVKLDPRLLVPKMPSQ
jgi:murein DD-endopeptidase MepM/ murein hydrolase activator NlpD